MEMLFSSAANLELVGLKAAVNIMTKSLRVGGADKQANVAHREIMAPISKEDEIVTYLMLFFSLGKVLQTAVLYKIIHSVKFWMQSLYASVSAFVYFF